MCRCPKDSSASFLVRKLPAAEGKAICVQAPVLGADSQTMEAWIQDFVALLESAAPGEGKEGGGPLLNSLPILFPVGVSISLRTPFVFTQVLYEKIQL